MTVYYISPIYGSDSNNGLGPDASHASNKPWLTIGKALGASGISSGDTVYLAPGTYREVVTVAMTSAVAETSIIGDVANTQGFKNGSGALLMAGEVRWTGYLVNDKTAASSSSLLTFAGRDFLTFRQIAFDHSSSSPIFSGTTQTSTNITIQDCTFIMNFSAGGSPINVSVGANVSAAWTIDRCSFVSRATSIVVTLATSATSDYDSNFVIKNCFALGGSYLVIINSSGANSFKGGGVDVLNCTIFHDAGAIVANSSSLSTSIPCTIYNSFINCGQTGIYATSLGEILEDYNLIGAATPRNLVSIGANSISDGSYAMLIDIGQSYIRSGFPRPFSSPSSGSSPLLGKFDNGQASAYDLLGAPRPSGSGYLSSSGSKAVGAFEYYNGSVPVTSPTRTGSNAIGILGAGYQDFWLPVNNASTTVSIYGQYDNAYAGALPQMHVTSGSGCGVSDASVAMVGAANNWEQLSLNFTPTSKGVVKIRLRSNDTSGGGWTYWDDFDTT